MLEKSYEREIRHIVKQNPRYVWGGASSEDSGLDCSGFLFLAAKRASIPGVGRTTAYNMARGLSGWIGVNVQLRDVDPADLVFFTFKPKPGKQLRPDGHVATMLLGSKSRLPEFAHASGTKGVVSVPPFGFRDISTIRRLTIGDKK
jgi:cell wall-associated NlpC family hydrolase